MLDRTSNDSTVHAHIERRCSAGVRHSNQHRTGETQEERSNHTMTSHVVRDPLLRLIAGLLGAPAAQHPDDLLARLAPQLAQ